MAQTSEKLVDHISNSRVDSVAETYTHHSRAPRVNTDAVILTRLQQKYPDKHIKIVPEYSCNILAFAEAGQAEVIPDPNYNGTPFGPFEWNQYVASDSRMNGDSGAIQNKVLFGKYILNWQKESFILYVIEGRDGTASYPAIRNNYIVMSTPSAADSLILAAGSYGVLLHDEIWVFDSGYWQKSAKLWSSIQKSKWNNVILDPDMKSGIIKDINRFFDGQNTYRRFQVPWKRGLIFYGPPGNGKTISIKSIMHMLYDRPDPIPSVYVKTLTSFSGPEYSLDLIFTKARQTAPCVLIFEDLDSIVTPVTRSYFFNQVDGLSENDGILMIGSTNHLDQLDDGITKRPSRFDRKHLFPNPNLEERVMYAQFWRRKLIGDDHEQDFDTKMELNIPEIMDGANIEFPEKMCPAIAKITDLFSFAYMQEAFVAALLAIAMEENEACEDSNFVMVEAQPDRMLDDEPLHETSGDSDDDLDKYVLWREIKKQIKILRDQLGHLENNLAYAD